jgi:hypothetical protein
VRGRCRCRSTGSGGCRRAPRSPATIASRAGARSANGPACPLRLLLRAPACPQARYIVFHCADDFGGIPYYESIDLIDAFHPQTILAWAMNDRPLEVGHGAPLRLRVERQLGYKHAKYVMRIEAVASLAGIGLGKGGYWEDRSGYQWYAGICMAETMRFLPKSDVLTLEEIEALADIFIARGVTRIRLTGGEPLVRRGVEDLVGRLGAGSGKVSTSSP